MGAVGDAGGLEGVEVVDGHAQFVHVALAFAGAHGLDRLPYATRARQGQRALHFLKLGVRQASYARHRLLQDRVADHALLQKAEGRLPLRPCGLEGLKEVAPSGQQKAALRRLGVQHGDQDGA